MIDLGQLANLASTTLERFRLDKKVALVVGGSRGLGQAMALALSSSGADVCVVARSNQDLQKTIEAISKIGRVGKYSASILNVPVKKEWVLSRIPMKRLGQLDDLFGPVVFLASEASNFVNGHILPVDGGRLAA